MNERVDQDLLGKALWEFHQGVHNGPLLTRSSLDQEEELPLAYLFRTYSEMPEIEQLALKYCRGKILDLGAGAGSHSLYLQNLGENVLALDQSEGAIRCCQARGIQKTVCSTYAHFRQSTSERFDTLLLLMNGVGLAGTLHELPAFLSNLKGLLAPKGQILLDSSDIRYVFEEEDDGGIWVPGDLMYYGDVEYTFLYDGQKSPDFAWLFVDPVRLEEAARDCGFEFQLLLEGPHYDYLARLELP